MRWRPNGQRRRDMPGLHGRLRKVPKGAQQFGLRVLRRYTERRRNLIDQAESLLREAK